jgi:WhiB family redox-sensing transcriptional regulator
MLSRSSTTLTAVDRALVGWLMVPDAPEPPTLEDLLNRPAWQRRAACRGVGPNVFFPKRGGTGREARAICAGCPVTEECLSFALDDEDNVGIWAGTSAPQRRRLDPTPAPEILAG